MEKKRDEEGLKGGSQELVAGWSSRHDLEPGRMFALTRRCEVNQREGRIGDRHRE